MWVCEEKRGDEAISLYRAQIKHAIDTAAIALYYI